jgi:methionyl-tRNA formyltransferase
LLQENNINSEKVKNLISDINPDLIIVIAYGQIISNYLLNSFKDKWINAHASLLPKLRGAAPINFAIINDFKYTGITIMKMIDKLDAGDILLQEKIEIKPADNFETLFYKLQDLSLLCLKKFLQNYKANKIVPIKQDDNIASYAHKIDKKFCRINWNTDAFKIYKFIKGLSPIPGAWTILNNKNIKIYDCKLTDFYCNNKNLESGTIIIDLKNLFVKCKDKFLQILELQESSKKKLKTNEFVNGLLNKKIDLKFL